MASDGTRGGGRRIDGRIPFRGFETWYRVAGDGEDNGKLPLLTLHGGPGACSDYLEPFESLADGGRRVIRYDQLGCGESGIRRPHDPEMWTVELFVEEVDAVRDALGLERVHILGQSWGGMLAMEYALTQPEGVAGLIIESSPASMPLWVSEANRLRADLPPDVQATLLEHEANGTTDSPEYEAAMDVFYDRHVCRVQPAPPPFQRTLDCMAANPEVYHYMNGPSEFHVIGTLKDWDITGRLGEIRLPTLVLSGRYDEATPMIAQAVADGIPGARWELLENSSHVCHLEEPERTMQLVGDFLAEVERSPGG
jgi:proline-specific peptidase